MSQKKRPKKSVKNARKKVSQNSAPNKCLEDVGGEVGLGGKAPSSQVSALPQCQHTPLSFSFSKSFGGQKVREFYSTLLFLKSDFQLFLLGIHSTFAHCPTWSALFFFLQMIWWTKKVSTVHEFYSTLLFPKSLNFQLFLFWIHSLSLHGPLFFLIGIIFFLWKTSLNCFWCQYFSSVSCFQFYFLL